MNLKKLLSTCVIFLFGICPLTISAKDPASKVFAQFSSSTTQVPNGASVVLFENVNGLSGINWEENNTVKVEHKGVYFLSVQARVGDKVFLRPGNVDLWIEHNGQILANTSTNKQISQWRTNEPINTQSVLALEEGDIIRVGYSATASGLGLKATQATANEPAIPSITLSIFKTN